MTSFPVTPSWLLLDTTGFGKQCYLECSMWFCKACRMYLERGFKANLSIINNFYTTPVGFICWKTKFSPFTLYIWCGRHKNFTRSQSRITLQQFSHIDYHKTSIFSTFISVTLLMTPWGFAIITICPFFYPSVSPSLHLHTCSFRWPRSLSNGSNLDPLWGGWGVKMGKKT